MPNKKFDEDSLDFRIEAISRIFTLENFSRPSPQDFAVIKAAMLRAANETLTYIIETDRDMPPSQ